MKEYFKGLYNKINKPGASYMIAALLVLIVSFFSPSFRDAIKTNLYSLVVTIIALLLFKSELAAQKEIKQLEVDAQEKRLLFDQKKHDTQHQFLYEQENKISILSDKLSSKIADNMQSDNRWAISALERAKLIPYSKTLFSDRFSHYQDEKKHLAKRFVPLLLKRCKRIITDSNFTKHIYSNRLGNHSFICKTSNYFSSQRICAVYFE